MTSNIGRIYPYLGSVPLDKVWSKTMESSEFDLSSLTADIVSAYVANNALSGDKVPEATSLGIWRFE